MMPGMIMLWHGSIESIPSGWHLCDGNMGTPDLRGWFVRGAGAAYPPGGVGGSHYHTHNFTGDGHYHPIPAGEAIQAGIGFDEFTAVAPAVGTTESVSHYPLYHQLCYIMKL